MCHEAGQSAFLSTQLYLSTNLDYFLFSNVSWHYSLSVLMCRKAVNQLITIKFATLIVGLLIYVIQFAKFGVDWSQGWGLVSSQALLNTV